MRRPTFHRCSPGSFRQAPFPSGHSYASVSTNCLAPYYLQKVKEQQEVCAELDKAFLALGKVGANVMGNL